MEATRLGAGAVWPLAELVDRFVFGVATRIFSTGFSYGGSMSLTPGCQMSDVFRAIGVRAGLNFQSCRPTNPVAVWQTNGDQDPIADPPGAMEAKA